MGRGFSEGVAWDIDGREEVAAAQPAQETRRALPNSGVCVWGGVAAVRVSVGGVLFSLVA